VPIVFHDDTLERLCGRRGRVAARPARELARLRVRVDGRGGTPDRILTLARWLARIPSRVIPVVELKRQATAQAERALVDAAAALLRRRRGGVAVISFSARMAGRTAALLPAAWVGPVLDRAPRGRRWLELARPLIALDRRLATKALVTRATNAGRTVWCWTVDEPREMKQLVARGVAGVITNRPDVARAALRRGGRGGRS
jgi:glycerophosphoryl diester phosphodiesterase